VWRCEGTAHLGETQPKLEERMEVRSAVRGHLGETVVRQGRRVEVEEERVAKLWWIVRMRKPSVED
jgi:hypothetical protein